MAHIIEEKWNEILEYMKEEHDMTDVSFNTWILPLEIVSFENSVLILCYPGDSNGAAYINRKYSLFLKVAVEECTGTGCDVRIVASGDLSKMKDKDPEAPAPAPIHTNLNPKYTFDTFVVGGNNKMAHAASLAVAEAPGETYNPLFIYGGAGLGKTHLMQSIANFILKRDPYARVMYVTSEKFTTELIDAIRNKNNITTTEFRAKYRNVDVLLIDDIQFIVNKESTQEEVFHTFNTLYEDNKQIILSSDRPPKDMETLEERLRSRFGCGLTVDIGLPDFETRMAILRKKEEMDGYNIDNEVIQYIATNIVSNIRELEGALNKITAMSRLEKKEITLDLAREALKDHIDPNGTHNVSPEDILNIVAEHFGLRTSDLTSARRSSDITTPRHIAMYLIRETNSLTYKKIADVMKKKDHTTIMHAIGKVEEDMKKDENLRNHVDILMKKINPS